MVGRHHDVLATAGVARLGGDDFDSTLAEVALHAVGLASSDLPKPAADRWIDQCRAAKEALNPSSRKISLDLEAALGKDAPRPEGHDSRIDVLRRLRSAGRAVDRSDGASPGTGRDGGFRTRVQRDCRRLRRRRGK